MLSSEPAVVMDSLGRSFCENKVAEDPQRWRDRTTKEGQQKPNMCVCEGGMRISEQQFRLHLDVDTCGGGMVHMELPVRAKTGCMAVVTCIDWTCMPWLLHAAPCW